MLQRIMPKNSSKIVCILFVFFCAVSAHSGGLYLNEYGTPVMGNAGAGSVAEASDASTSFHNPAGMTLLGQRQFMLSLGLGYSDVSFDTDSSRVGGGDGGNAGGWIPILGTFYAQPIKEDLWFGFSTFTLSGAALDYGSGWVGRNQCDEVTILTVTAMPTLAYRVNDWLSVGAGPAIWYGSLDLKVGPVGNTNGEIEIDGDDVAYGYSVSTMIELSKSTRVGVFYLSETSFEFDGDLKTKGGPVGGLEFGSDTDLDLAQLIRGSVYHRLNDKWAVVGSLGWEDWSTMDNVNISTERGSRALSKNWKDTYHYAAGLHYNLSDKWLLRTGISYDTSPVDSDDRTADMPIDRQIRYAVGADYQWTESLTVGGSFVYADYGSAKIDAPGFSGDYNRNDLYFLGLHANWIF
ncbi:MAG: OmpP1/FadL family transporter [Planctomycetota bacterium]|jgi:long-chain fatty acid transport protein